MEVRTFPLKGSNDSGKRFEPFIFHHCKRGKTGEPIVLIKRAGCFARNNRLYNIKNKTYGQLSIAAWAAAMRAIGTRKGEHDT